MATLQRIASRRERLRTPEDSVDDSTLGSQVSSHSEEDFSKVAARIGLQEVIGQLQDVDGRAATTAPGVSSLPSTPLGQADGAVRSEASVRSAVRSLPSCDPVLAALESGASDGRTELSSESSASKEAQETIKAAYGSGMHLDQLNSMLDKTQVMEQGVMDQSVAASPPPERVGTSASPAYSPEVNDWNPGPQREQELRDMATLHARRAVELEAEQQRSKQQIEGQQRTIEELRRLIALQDERLARQLVEFSDVTRRLSEMQASVLGLELRETELSAKVVALEVEKRELTAENAELKKLAAGAPVTAAQLGQGLHEQSVAPERAGALTPRCTRWGQSSHEKVDTFLPEKIAPNSTDVCIRPSFSQATSRAMTPSAPPPSSREARVPDDCLHETSPEAFRMTPTRAISARRSSVPTVAPAPWTQTLQQSQQVQPLRHVHQVQHGKQPIHLQLATGHKTPQAAQNQSLQSPTSPMLQRPQALSREGTDSIATNRRSVSPIIRKMPVGVSTASASRTVSPMTAQSGQLGRVSPMQRPVATCNYYPQSKDSHAKSASGSAVAPPGGAATPYCAALAQAGSAVAPAGSIVPPSGGAVGPSGGQQGVGGHAAASAGAASPRTFAALPTSYSVLATKDGQSGRAASPVRQFTQEVRAASPMRFYSTGLATGLAQKVIYPAGSRSSTVKAAPTVMSSMPLSRPAVEAHKTTVEPH